MGQVFSQSVGSRDLIKEPIGGLTDDLVRLHQEKPEFKQEYLTEMVASTMRAGGDTMTGTLTAILTLGNGNPAIKARLRREVDGGLPPVSEKPIVSFREGTGLEYTTATLKESTRHWPVVGLAMYREVPERGLTLSDGSGHEYYIPPGTTVGASPLALQCNKAIFGDDAEEFRPERWLGDEKTRLALEKYSLVFGSQDRSCPGRNISEQVIYKSIPTLMKHFDIEVWMPDKMLTYGTALMTGVKARFHVRE
jgi:cytochrome P450